MARTGNLLLGRRCDQLLAARPRVRGVGVVRIEETMRELVEAAGTGK